MKAVTLLIVSCLFLAAGCKHDAPVAKSSRPLRINPAVEMRQDPYWQEAAAEIRHREPFLHLANSFGAFDRKIIHGDLAQKTIALTFDDGPHYKFTPQLLKTLADLHVKATFFVVGKMVEKHPELVRMEAEAGHEVGNHTFSHVTLTKISPEDVMTEYRACNDLIQGITGSAPRFCRPPGGDYNQEVIEAASNLGMTTTLWTDDPADFDRPSDVVLLQRTLDNATNGGIILLHDGIPQTLRVLPTLVNTLRSRGYRFVTMTQLEEDARRSEILMAKTRRHNLHFASTTGLIRKG